jgi:site-specific recombinase XerD
VGTELALVDPGQIVLPGAREPDAAAGHPYWVYLARLKTEESRRTVRGCLSRIAEILTGHPIEGPDPGQHIPWHQVTYAHVVFVQSVLRERDYSPSHINKHLCSLRRVLKEARRLGLMSADDYERAQDIDGEIGTRVSAGRNIATDELAAMLDACLSDPRPLHAARDAAIIAVLQSTGSRRAESAGALIERYDSAARRLVVHGKGNKQREVYIHPTAAPYLDRWLAIVGGRKGPVFRPIDRYGNIQAAALSPRAVGYVVAERREQAGLRPLSTHDFRRTFIGDFLSADGDLVQAQKVAGHARVTTTADYDRRPDDAIREVVDKLSLPAPAPLQAMQPEP